MKEVVLECQGLPCPQPVLKCKKCIEQDSPHVISLIVDNEPAQENVSRFMSSKGYTVTVNTLNGEWIVRGETPELTKSDSQSSDCEICAVMSRDEIDSVSAKTVAFITTECLGVGDDELGGKLMLNFLATLPELGSSLWRIVLVNGGVKLACNGHVCLEKLEILARSGVEILVCGTCLDFFGLLEKKRIGETTNMLDVVTSLQLATKLINV